MAIEVTCESCAAKFRAGDSAAGKQTKCPKCGGVIRIPVPNAEPEIYEAEEADFGGFSDEELAGPPSPPDVSGDGRKPCPACGESIMQEAVKCRYCGEIFDRSLKGVLGNTGQVDPEAWSKVRGGLNTIYICTGIIFGTAILMGILGALTAAMGGGQAGGPGRGAAILIILGGLAILGAAIGILVGYVRCTNVPQESGAKGFVTWAVICMVGNIILNIAGRGAESEAITGIGSLVSLVGNVLFILFIRRAATYLNDYELASSAGKFLIFCAAFIAGCFVLGFAFAAAAGGAAVAIVGLVFVVSAIVFLLWFLRLIRGLRDTIDQRIGF
ncbi:MAG: hypothetical protein RH917_14405 [Lacipirellulaceae bacterium]